MDSRKMMTEVNHQKWLRICYPERYSDEAINVTNDSKDNEPSTSESNEDKRSESCKNKTEENKIKIEDLYERYFSKSVQDTIVIIANILNVISLSNNHHKSRMDESFRKKTEAEKLKERCDANRLHGRHKKILEKKLKSYFTDVVSLFQESEFVEAFQMFFLSILTVLRVLDQPKFKKGSIFKNLVLLLWNILKNTEYNNPKVFTLLRSKDFRPNCIDIISLIEDCRDSDSGANGRMSLFFVSTVSSREHFQTVIDAINNDSNEDLELLIDYATFQSRINSQFRDPVNSSTPQHSNIKVPVTATITATVTTTITATVPTRVTATVTATIPARVTATFPANVPARVTANVPTKVIAKVPATIPGTVPINVPAREIIRKHISSDGKIQHWILAKHPDGTFQ